MLLRMLVHFVFLGLALLLLDKITSDSMIDPRVVVFLYSNVAFFTMLLIGKVIVKFGLFFRILLSILFYGLVWWILLISSMFVCGAFEDVKFVGVYLRSGVAESRQYFFAMLSLVFLLLAFFEWKDRHKRTVSSEDQRGQSH